MTDLTNNTHCNSTTQRLTRPQFKVEQKPYGVTVSVDLPGAAKENISITSEKQQLKVSATRATSTPEEWTLLNQVQDKTGYQLTLNVHADLDLTKNKASVENGVLSLENARLEESLPRKIDILS